MIKELTWEKATGAYASGSRLKCGKVTIAATVRAIGNKSVPDAPLWFPAIELPGVVMKVDAEGNQVRYKTEDEAKAVAVRAVQVWFGWVLK